MVLKTHASLSFTYRKFKALLILFKGNGYCLPFLKYNAINFY